MTVQADAAPPDLTRAEARKLTRRIRKGLEHFAWLCNDVIEAYRRRAWAAMDYPTWDDYVRDQFGDMPIITDGQRKRELVAKLDAGGLSSSAIESVAHVTRRTITDVRRAQVVPGDRPGKRLGLDGQMYPDERGRRKGGRRQLAAVPDMPPVPESARAALPDMTPVTVNVIKNDVSLSEWLGTRESLGCCCANNPRYSVGKYVVCGNHLGTAISNTVQE